jgi:hypothetical protein
LELNGAAKKVWGLLSQLQYLLVIYSNLKKDGQIHSKTVTPASNLVTCTVSKALSSASVSALMQNRNKTLL